MSVQGLELLVTVLLARNRQPPPTVAAGVPHAEFAAELLTLPSGLLAMVCEAIVKLKVRLGAGIPDFWLTAMKNHDDRHIQVLAVPPRPSAPEYPIVPCASHCSSSSLANRPVLFTRLPAHSGCMRGTEDGPEDV